MKSLGVDTKSYYKFHAKIYDLTRWAFLFGRKTMVKNIVELKPSLVLEVGCGTGSNLMLLKKQAPHVRCIGLDTSPDMLNLARQKSKDSGIEWILGEYSAQSLDPVLATSEAPDVILFSYALSMFNPGWEESVELAHRQIKPNGRVCIVDFHYSKYIWFRKWMQMNHVRLGMPLLYKVSALAELELAHSQSGFLGLWNWIALMSCPVGLKNGDSMAELL